MISKILKVTGIILGANVVLVLVFYTYIYFNINARMSQTFTNFPEEVYAIPSDSASIALGEHVAQIKGCMECHGENLGGKVMADDPALGRLIAKNLTRGKNGTGSKYTDEDWIRALRHGVNNNGKPLLFMPSHETTHLTRQDLVAVIAYCKSIPPVNSELPTTQIGPLGRVLTYFGKLPLLSVEMIDHTQKAVTGIEKTVSADYGKYLAVSCTGCHRENFKGGDGHVPGSPQVADLTATGNVAKWTDAQFIQALRTGETPEGKTLDNEFMPWQMTKQYTDDELKSLYLFLKAQP